MEKAQSNRSPVFPKMEVIENVAKQTDAINEPI